MGLSPGYIEKLTQFAEDTSAPPAIVTGKVALSYGDLLARVGAGLCHLRVSGIGLDAVVGLSLDDEVEHLVAALALMAAGASHITLATHDTPILRMHLAERVRMTHVISATQDYAIAGTAFMRWPSQAHAVPVPLGSDRRHRGTLFLKTSGTTGDMNIVAFSEEQVAAQAGRHTDYSGE